MVANPAAVAAMSEQDKQDRERRLFEYMIEAFVQAWAPQDRYERSQFDTQLHSLVRQIYADAQQPVLEQLGKIGMYSPLPVFPHVPIPEAK